MSLINLTGGEELPRQVYVDLVNTDASKVTAADAAVGDENPGGAEMTPEQEQKIQEVTEKTKTIVVDGPLGHVVTEVLRHYYASQEDVGTMMAIVRTPDLQQEREFDHYLYATDAKTVEHSSMVELANRIASHVAERDFSKVVISIEMNGGDIRKAASFEELMIARGARVVHPRATISAEGIDGRVLSALKGRGTA